MPNGMTLDGAVVRTKSVVVAVPFAGKLIVVVETTPAELKLHEASDGKPAQFAETFMLVPDSPFCEVNVNVVDPLCPGALTLIFVGFAATLKLGAGVTVSVMAVEVAPP